MRYNYIINLVSSHQLNTIKDKKKNKKLSEKNTIFNPQNKYSKKQNLNTIATRTKQPEQKVNIK